jgi:hypothetical protein
MLMRGDDGNMTTPTLTSAGYMFGGPKINQSLGIIRYLYWGSDSFYHALNVNVDKKLAHGFQFQVAYTWSKSIDDDSSTIAGDSFSNGLNSVFYAIPRALRGPSDFNIGQSLTINGLWVVPTPKERESESLVPSTSILSCRPARKSPCLKRVPIPIGRK